MPITLKSCNDVGVPQPKLNGGGDGKGGRVTNKQDQLQPIGTNPDGSVFYMEAEGVTSSDYSIDPMLVKSSSSYMADEKQMSPMARQSTSNYSADYASEGVAGPDYSALEAESANARSRSMLSQLTSNYSADYASEGVAGPSTMFHIRGRNAANVADEKQMSPMLSEGHLSGKSALPLSKPEPARIVTSDKTVDSLPKLEPMKSQERVDIFDVLAAGVMEFKSSSSRNEEPQIEWVTKERSIMSGANRASDTVMEFKSSSSRSMLNPVMAAPVSVVFTVPALATPVVVAP